MIRLVAIDLDDTLLGEELRILEETRGAIQECMERGILVTIATGRMMRTAFPFVEELDISIPIISYNGALIAEPISGKVFNHSPVPLEYAREVVIVARKHSLPLNIYIDEELYVEKITEDVKEYSRKYNIPLTVIDDVLPLLKREPTKLLAIGEAELLLGFEEELREELGDALHITRSKPQYSEIMKAGVSKGQGLAALARKFGIQKEEVMAIGDSYNDIEMLEYAGVGIAVANASDYVKERADFIAPFPYGDGVFWAIEKFALR